MKEKWKWIKGFEGLYKISNKGRVKSYKRKKSGHVMSSKNASGYEVITLYKNNKFYYKRVQRLVAKMFIPNPKNKPEVNHKDMNKHNNCVDNLEWVTSSENQKHAVKNKPEIMEELIKYAKTKANKPVVQIDIESGEVINEFPSMREAERQTEVGHEHISAVVNEKIDRGYKRKTAGGYKWELKEEYYNED